ncbi:MAG: nucleotidyltransferase domain-containing protein [Deferrisomatales bacterium]
MHAPLSRHGRVLGTYVFGSYAWGEPDADSDVDVAVFVEGVETWDPRRRASVVAEVQGAVGDDVELHLFPAGALASPPRASLAQLVVNKGVPVD